MNTRLLFVSLAAGMMVAGSAYAQPWRMGPMEHDGRPVPSRMLSRSGPPALDPVIMEASRYMPAGTFLLNNQQQVETARFGRPRDVAICVASRVSPLSRRGIPRAWPDRVRPVPLAVSWNGYRAMVPPDQCLHLRAQDVHIRAAEPFSNSESLRGRIMFDR